MKHAPEECPRCGGVFTCKVNSVTRCDCQKIFLTKKETEYIRLLSIMQYEGGCLCNQCLEELKKESETA